MNDYGRTPRLNYNPELEKPCPACTEKVEDEPGVLIITRPKEYCFECVGGRLSLTTKGEELLLFLERWGIKREL